MQKAYDAKLVEDGIYADWEKSGYFTPENLPNLERRTESFSIVLPPPNVTGTLHMGHAVMLAIQDALIRFQRMRGKRALWVPGTDHAAIATQTKVEKNLIASGLHDPRRELGREKFLEHVEAFAQESHDTIVNQMKKMGASVDWSREAFTLDETRNVAVRTVFKRMYDDGLIYRGHRVINWCPRCLSTLADDELEYKETSATLYTFKYANDFPITIATTRPETKVGDTAVAVHPEDERYRHLIGKSFDVEFAGVQLSVKIVASAGIDKDFGTGALGVTPAHSKVDEEIAKEHDLPFIAVIGEDGRMMQNAGVAAGMFAREGRKAVVEWIRDQGLMVEEKDMQQNLSVCYRCDTPVEPLPKTQWFIDVNKKFTFKQSVEHNISGVEDGQDVTLKEMMQRVVKNGDVNIIPDRFEKTYFHWIDNLRDWNISRQLWYGHRIPVWYRAQRGTLSEHSESKGSGGDEIYVGVEVPEGEGWVQDEDTLDTWFSSGLWTFSTLGWPNEETWATNRIYHPTNVLETGYDILFFWVARMILMTTYAIGEVPFKDVYLHGLVRDEKGRKMSKSLGNIIDPLEMIEKYGADATRLSLLIGSTPGNDTKLSEERVASYRNFTNKLWNISRFVFGAVEGPEGSRTVKHVEAVEAITLADEWILARFDEVTREVTEHFEKYELSMLGEKLRAFTWNDFADWYLEIAKIQNNESTHNILLYVLERLLKLWHPFMPFVTEEIYKQFGEGKMIVASWPEGGVRGKGQGVRGGDFTHIQNLVTAIRNIRATYKVPPSKMMHAVLNGELDEASQTIVKHLARLDVLEFSSEKPHGSASAVVGEMTVHVPLAGIVDTQQERGRLEKEITSVAKYAEGLERKLGNKAFAQNAPADIVEQEQTKLAEAQARLVALKEELANIAS